jgi:hypothetical protein
MASAAEMGCGLKAVAALTLGCVLGASAATHCLVIAGLGGEPDYEQRFAAQAQEMEKLLKAAGPDVQVQELHGSAATKQAVRSALEGIAKQVKAGDAFVLALIGHGTFDGEDYKFNLPGPDVSATELASLLDRIPARQLVMNGTSASGGSVHALQRPNRTVITATKSGTEKNATVFPRYWVEALRDPAADTDKNEVITALEAFKFAELKTKQFYETNKRIATEHPQIDGNEAQRFALLRLGATQMAANDPEKRALLAKREDLELKIDQLKFQKAAMPTEEYRQQLQTLLLELARTQAELDK